MNFKKVNYKKMELSDKSKVPKSYIRQVEKGTKLAHEAEQAKTKASEATSENDEHSE